MFEKGHKVVKGERKAKKISPFHVMETSFLDIVKKFAPRYFNLFVKIFSGNSRTAAIKGKCLQCINLESIKEITDCVCYSCSLWRYRPYQGKEEDSDE